MSTRRVRFSHVVEKCTWCATPLGPEMRVVIAGGRFAGPSAHLDRLRGHIVHVETLHGPDRVLAIVPLRDTPAHRAGYDLLFVLCSTTCRDALDEAIGDEAMVVSVADGQAGVSRAMAVKARRATALALPGAPRRRPS